MLTPQVFNLIQNTLKLMKRNYCSSNEHYPRKPGRSLKYPMVFQQVTRIQKGLSILLRRLLQLSLSFHEPCCAALPTFLNGKTYQVHAGSHVAYINHIFAASQSGA